MPVYGKGRQKRPTNKSLVDYGKIQRKKKRIVTNLAYFTFENTPLKKIERKCSFSITKEIKRRIKRAKEPVVVLDWGCGEGTAISELARIFEKKINAYGCADVSHKEWLNTKEVKFVHATEHDALRYFKDGTIDFIYSHWGINNIPNKLVTAYLDKLSLKLKPAGKILLTPFQNKQQKESKTYSIGSAVFKSEEITFGTTIITRIK